MAKILIVEDEPDIVLSLEEDLRRQGHTTRAVGDGAQGLEVGRQDTWDLILLDVMLPTMDGFDVCSELRKAGVATPIILLTARAQEAEKELGLDSGADDYVTKPFSLPELRRGGQPVEITAQELRLLRALLQNRGRVLSRDQLIESAWGHGVAITDRAVDTHVFNLRKKIEPAPSEPRFLVGVRGLGYRFEEEN